MSRVIKRVLIFFLAAAVLVLAAWLGFVFFRAPYPTILMYHSVGDPALGDLDTPPAIFEQQMRFLSSRRYRVVPLAEMVERLKRRERIPSGMVALTFDDGCENNYTKVFPVLKKYGLPATMFVVADGTGRHMRVSDGSVRPLSPEMIRQMSGSGLIEIGSHSMNHRFLPRVGDARVLTEEIVGSKRALEETLGKPVRFFCYPEGGYTPAIETYVKNAGYEAAFTTMKHGNLDGADVYALRRIKVGRSCDNLATFYIVVSGYYLRMKELSTWNRGRR